MLVGGLLAGGYVYRNRRPGALGWFGRIEEPPAAQPGGGRSCAGDGGGGARVRPAIVFRFPPDRPRGGDGAAMTDASSSAWLASAAQDIGPWLLGATLAAPLLLLAACLSKTSPARAGAPVARADARSRRGDCRARRRPDCLRSAGASRQPRARRAGRVAHGGGVAVVDRRQRRDFLGRRKAKRAFRDRMAPDADRQSRRLHRRRSFDLLSRLRAGQHSGLWIDRQGIRRRRPNAPAACTWRSRFSARRCFCSRSRCSRQANQWQPADR